MGQLNPIYLGIKGTVIALHPADGSKLWVTKLKGVDFVNVALGQDALYATTSGEIFCLDPQTGAILWKNPLTGFGLGLITMAGRGLVASNDAVIAAQKQRQDQQNASASA